MNYHFPTDDPNRVTYEFTTATPQGVDDLIGFLAELERQIWHQKYLGRVNIELPDLPKEEEKHECL